MRLSSILWGIAALLWFGSAMITPYPKLAILDLVIGALNLFMAGYTSLDD